MMKQIPPKRLRAHPPTDSVPLLSDEEILRRLRAIKFRPTLERYARRGPTLNPIVQASGLSRVAVYAIINGRRNLAAKSRAKLSKALTSLRM